MNRTFLPVRALVVMAMHVYAMPMHRGGRITKRTGLRVTRSDFLHIAVKFGQKCRIFGANRTPQALPAAWRRFGHVCRAYEYAPTLYTPSDCNG